MKLAFLPLLAALVAATPPVDRSVELGEIVQGTAYYNRPGASLSDHNSDLTACVRDTSFEVTPNAYNSGLVGALVWSGPLAGVAAARVENCMIVKGWRVVRLPSSEGEKLAALPTEALAQRLAPWIGAPVPEGEIVRQWANEALRPHSFKVAGRPARPSKAQLSFRIVDSADKAREAERAAPNPPQPWREPSLDRRWPRRAMPPSEAGNLPPGAGAVVVRVEGISLSSGLGVLFTRVGRDNEARPSVEDHAPDLLVATKGLVAARKENWFIFVVPPGEWRISATGVVYCLGSPSFEVKAGEVVYAGGFDLNGDSLTPDLSLDRVRPYLGGPAAERVKAASYRNGSRGSCRVPSAIYAMEFPDVPFAEGYRWGSVAPR